MYPIFNSKIDNDKPILLIGNSPCVKNKLLGEHINLNKFNIIRFNLCEVRGYEQYVGIGTTYFIINGITWNTKRNKVSRENILISELPHTPQYKILCDHPTKINFKSVQILPNYSKKYLNEYPTSGMMAISYFLQFYEQIYIYGFTFDDSHYYNSNFKKGAGHHNYQKEKEVVLNLEKKNRVIFLDQHNISKITDSLLVQSSPDHDIPVNNKEITILSTNHVWNRNNKYFHFDSSDINLPLGETIYIKANIERLKRVINVILWGYNNGGESGDSHGRVFSEQVSFMDSDKLKVIKKYPIIKVLCNKHKFGNEFLGMYFHFNSGDIKFKNGNTYNFFIPKLNIMKKIIIWTNTNGGKQGNCHGRYIKNRKKYDFYTGDILVLLS